MWHLLEIIDRVIDFAETVAWSRFLACLILSLGLIGYIYCLTPSQNLWLGISILIAIFGVVTGLIWQLQKRAD